MLNAWKIFAPITAAVAICAASAVAQNATEQQPQGRRTERSQDTASQQTAGRANLDRQIAACMFLSNQEEIALAQFAQQHAQHEQVKQLAKTLIEQHQKALTAIQDASPEVAELKLATNATETPDAGQASNESGAASDPAVAMLLQIKNECLKLTQKELSQYQGAEFDKAFVGQQLGAHLGMLAQLRGSKSFASPELQKVIDEGEKMTTMHMDAAKKLMDQIKDEGAKTASAATRGTAQKRE
jgi:predicted outer membrane protein